MSRTTENDKKQDGAELLMAWRTRRRLDKASAAKAFDVSRQTYTKWESREKTPDMPRWFQIDRQTRGAVPWASWTTDEVLVHLVRRVVSPRARKIKRSAEPQTEKLVEKTVEEASAS